MKAVLYILLGWSLTTATAWALGVSFLRRLKLRLYPAEELLLGFLTGASLLSALLFLLCALHLVYKGVLVALALVSFGLLAITPRPNPPEDTLPPVPRWLKAIITPVLAVFAVVYFINALAPETSPDGAGYHIPIAAMYSRAHGFVRATWNTYFNLSQGIELLFMMAFAFGRHSAAALTHFTFLLVLPFLIIAYGRRFHFAVAGAAAAVLVFVSPVVGRDGSSAYIDVALTAVVFAMFYFLQLWYAGPTWTLLVPVGLLAGFAVAAKYTAISALVYAVLFVVWPTRRAAGFAKLRPAALVASVATLMFVPWLLKNWRFVDNPVGPFANRIFPNPYFHVSTEQEYRDYLRKYDLASYWQLPLELTVRGQQLSGLYGPAFLLLPIALLALRYKQGRHLLLSALIIGSTYYANIGSRLLMPVVPLLCLAWMLPLAAYRWALVPLLLVHAVLSWPSVMNAYCDPYAWRLGTLPLAAAVRAQPEDVYLAEHWPPYNIDRMLEREVQPGGTTFVSSAIPEAYTSRRILVPTQGALNDRMKDVLEAAVDQNFQPRHRVDFHFTARSLLHIRLLQTGYLADQWNVAEFRVFHNGAELARDPRWRLRAHPNPWDVQLAFDNAPVTRWRSWEPAKPGMFIEIDFGAPVTTDSARIETSDYDNIKLRLEAMETSGKWILLDDRPSWTDHPVTQDLRPAAAEEVKRIGAQYLLIEPSYVSARDFSRYASRWGIRPIAEAGGWRLFRID